MTEINETSGLWLTGMPSDELEQDLKAWEEAERVMDGLIKPFMPAGTSDAVFVALVDAQARIRQHVKQLRGDPRQDRDQGRRSEVSCIFPGCQRPAWGAPEETAPCKEHRESFDAQADYEAWDFAAELLEPWVTMVEMIGSDELLKLMRQARDSASDQVNTTLDRVEAAQRAADS